MSYARSDLDNAEFFAERHREFRHVQERRLWLEWREGRWRRDATGSAKRAAKETVRELFRLAADLDGDAQKDAVRWALASRSEARLRALLTLAESEPGIAIGADDLDRDPYLLCCSNGTIDLRTGVLSEHRPDDLISLGTEVAFDPAARCPRWLSFLDEVFDGDDDLVAFVQRLVGYLLTGDTREHVLGVLHGSGCNGKTTLIETLKKLLGDLAATAAFDTFTRARSDRGPRNEIARLHRSRLVVASESGSGHRLDEALVKSLTGGDTITARFLYAEHFEFQPRFKLLLVTNHRPRVDGSDDAVWRRLRLVPFDVSFEGREDPALPDKLAGELPGILVWAVEGCLTWQADGLGTTPKVAAATAAYRADEDILGAFIADYCTLEGSVAAEQFRDRFDAFCREIGEKSIDASVLGRQLSARGIESARSREGRIYKGISLIPAREPLPVVTGNPGNSPRVRAHQKVTQTTGNKW